MKRLVVILAALCLILGALSRLPLAWFVGDDLSTLDPDARAIGTLWNGAVIGIDGLPPIQTSLSGTSMALTADGPTLRLDGTARTSGLTNTTLSTPIRSLARFDPRLSGLAGQASFTLDSLTIDDGQCVSAVGTASTDVLAANATRWGWQGPTLSGPITCENGQIVIDLGGEQSGQSATVRLSLDLSGPYRTDITLDTQDPAASAILPLFGFERAGNTSWRISEAGSWQ